MEVNGFNSEDYLYFRIKSNIPSGNIAIGSFQEGDIVKIPLQFIERYVFNGNYEKITSYSLPHEIKSYPAGDSFDLLKYIKRQDPLIFNRDGSLTLYFYGPYVLINDWLKGKIESSNPSMFSGILGTTTIKEENLGSMEELEKLNNTQLSISNGDYNFIAEYNKNLSQIYQMPVRKHGLEFEVPFSKGEEWSFDNISLLLSLLNQNFVNLIYNSVEITGPEKDKIFFSEYKDNIPNSTIRYYCIKDGICVKKLSDLSGECSFEHFGCGYSSLRAIGSGDISVCEYNPNNFNSDGSIRCFYVDYSDGMCDYLESEVLKIADRVPQEEAIKMYSMDIEATEMHNKQVEAEQYVKEHLSRYQKVKRRNPSMSEIEFMESELARERGRLASDIIDRLNEVIAMESSNEEIPMHGGNK